MHVANKIAGSGFIIRDEHGNFIQAGSVRHEHIEDPFMGELLSCREGLEATKMKGCAKVLLQTLSGSCVVMGGQHRCPN